MARIAEGLFDQVWAETPGSADDVITPTDAMQVTGWSNAHFQPGGELPEGETFNALWNRQTAFAVDVQRHGVLEWSANQNFEHPAACFGGDDLYVSLANSGPDHGGAVDPTGLVGTTRWRLSGSSNQFVPAPQVAGTADAIELSPNPAILVYTVGLTLIFQAEADSTAGVTVAVSGLAATNLHFTDGQAGSGDIVSGRFYTIRYDGTNFVVVSGAEYAVRPISAGGTGGRTAAQARTNLGVAPAAAGVPAAGADAQVLAKASAADYDTEWITLTIPPAGIQTLTEGNHIDISGTGTSRTIAVDTGTVSGALAVLGTAGRFAAARIPELQNLDGTLDVASGGTGATDAAGARTNLAAAAANHNHDARYYTQTAADARFPLATGIDVDNTVPNLFSAISTLIAEGSYGAVGTAVILNSTDVAQVKLSVFGVVETATLVTFYATVLTDSVNYVNSGDFIRLSVQSNGTARVTKFGETSFTSLALTDSVDFFVYVFDS